MRLDESSIEAAMPKLRRWAMSFTNGNTHEADDLIQSTLENAWRGRHTLDGQGIIDNWLHRVMHNAWVDSKRVAGRRIDAPMDPVVMTEMADAGKVRSAWDEPTVDFSRLRAALEQLTEDQRAALALTSSGVTHVEAAEKLGVPLGTLKARVRRAHRRLRQLLDDES